MGGLASLEGTVLLVGAGKMGGALMEGWLARGLPPARVAVNDPAPPPGSCSRSSRRLRPRWCLSSRRW